MPWISGSSQLKLEMGISQATSMVITVILKAYFTTEGSSLL